VSPADKLALLACVPPLLVELYAVLLLGINWRMLGLSGQLMGRHGDLLVNVRNAVDARGEDGKGPKPPELWAGAAREMLHWLAGLLEQASSIEERAKDLATKRHSEEWQKFWDDITAVTNYAWFVCLRRCLEIWATEVLLRCPASVALHGHGEKSLPDEARAGIGNALADVYERFADTSKEAAVIEDVRARLVDAVRSVEGKADKADEAGEKAVAAWAENAIGLLEHAVG